MSTLSPDIAEQQITKFVIEDNAGCVFIIEYRGKRSKTYTVYIPGFKDYVMDLEAYDACIRVLYLSLDVPKSGPFAWRSILAELLDKFEDML